MARVRLEFNKLQCRCKRTQRSKFHIRARKLLKNIFHSYRILEEVKLMEALLLTKGVLYLDFYIPQIMLVRSTWTITL